MNRRYFLKALAASGMSAFAPSMTGMRSLYRPANAAVDYPGVIVAAPAVMPQVINIFLYGGPSELAGNLSNIIDIDTSSQNAYTDAFDSRIIALDDTGDGANGLVTPHGFWRGAGGLDMQFLLDEDFMSVYRTIHKVKDPTRSHRESILMGLKGSLDVEAGAGVGTRIASMLLQHRSQYEGGGTRLADDTPIGDLTDPVNMPLPFVSFEGETRIFQQDPDVALPLALRYLTLDADFDNPYNRNDDDDAAALEAIVSKVADQAYRDRFRGVVDSFVNRETLADIVSSLEPVSGVNFFEDTSGNLLPGIPLDPAYDNDRAQNGGIDQVTYPDNRYTDRIRAAVTLAIENPATMYISVGGGLGGWDDHNNGVSDYPGRMQDLFEVLRAAMLHIKYAGTQTAPGFTTPGGKARTTDNIIINVFGDFGRRVNLNNSLGWDHGNNQNLFTLGGGAVRAANALGKVVGTTERVGDPGTNNQVTEPAAGSYQAEPMSIAASVYSYFGAQNPELLTADAERNPAGDAAIDETLAGVTPAAIAQNFLP